MGSLRDVQDAFESGLDNEQQGTTMNAELALSELCCKMETSKSVNECNGLCVTDTSESSLMMREFHWRNQLRKNKHERCGYARNSTIARSQ